MKNTTYWQILIAATLFISTGGYAWARDHQAVEMDVLARSTTSWDGTSLPAYPEGQPEVTIRRYTIQPHASLAWHRHPVINAGVMISGELTVVTESGDTLRLGPGDTIVEVMNQWHHGINEGDGPAEIIVFYAGVVDKPLVERKRR